MVRRPADTRSRQKAHLSESVNPSIEGAKTSPEGTTPSVEKAKLQPENTDQTLERVEIQPKVQENSGNLSSKRKGKYSSGAAVRRSARLQDAVIPLRSQELKCLIDEVALSESEDQDEKEDAQEDELPANEETNQSDSTMGDTNLGEKIDYLVQLFKEQRKTMEALESMAAKKSSSNEFQFSSQGRYKRLYIKSQKKIEVLTEENRQLARKLEIAVAKLEAYEKGTRAYSEMVEKVKDMILVANLSQATQNAVNLSSQKALGTSVSRRRARASLAKSGKLREVKKK